MEKKWYIQIWRDGKFFDLWHANHFLAGALLGQIAFHFQKLWIGFLISLILMIAWEIFEVLKKITETRFNQTMDIILGIIGFFIAYKLGLSLNNQSFSFLFILLIIFWLLLELWGYIAYDSRQLPPRHGGKNSPPVQGPTLDNVTSNN